MLNDKTGKKINFKKWGKNKKTYPNWASQENVLLKLAFK
jgi:hypothetical protein